MASKSVKNRILTKKKLKFSFGYDRDAALTDTDTGILKSFSDPRKGGPQKKMIEFGQEKSGKSQEISRGRSFDNPVNALTDRLPLTTPLPKSVTYVMYGPFCCDTFR